MKVTKKATVWILVVVMSIGMLIPSSAFGFEGLTKPTYMENIQIPEPGNEPGGENTPHQEVPPVTEKPDGGQGDKDNTSQEIPSVPQEPDSGQGDKDNTSQEIPSVPQEPDSGQGNKDNASQEIPSAPQEPDNEQDGTQEERPREDALDEQTSEIDPDFGIDTSEIGLEIHFENGLHSIVDPDYPNEPIILYCMNNKRNWPHVTPNTPNVPNYTDGQLTPDQFDNPSAYKQCMRKLRKILFAGYPYNTERLYKIVDSGEDYVPTEDEFDEMLIPLPHLIEAFPTLGHHIFTLKDKFNQQHLAVLRTFIQDVQALAPDKKTENGLTYQDIISMPFYKAANCLTFETQDPLETFALLYPNSYFMTESQAYSSTQNAIWKLLKEYGVPDNDFSNIEHDGLAKVLLQYAKHGDVLRNEPEYAEIFAEGDLKFSYNEEDQKWHTGKLKIIEPPYYHGVYDLNLPEGVSLLDSKLTHVYGNEEYELVSTREIQEGEVFTGTVNYYWMEDYRQYTPLGEGNFQDMIGGIIREKNMNFSILYGSNDLGNLKITKSVSGKQEDREKEFSFTLTLENSPIDGHYGGLEFQDGVAEFTLKHGKSRFIKNLPAGAIYTVSEVPDDSYKVKIENGHGIITTDQTCYVNVNNTKITDAGSGELVITKSVLNDEENPEKEFRFVLKLEDCPINGTYGDLTFTDGIVRFYLKAGESKRATDLPAGTAYTVTEVLERDYQVTAENDRGIIEKDQTITASFVNTKLKKPNIGGIAITKVVVGDQKDRQKDFPFTLTLKDCPINGTYGDLTFIDGVAEFTLKHEEYKRAIDLPAGTEYTVTETQDDGYTVIAENEQRTILADQTILVSFVNKKIEKDSTGGLMITKSVTGNWSDRKRDFPFTLTLKNCPINGTYGDLTFIDGVAEFTLKHGESKTAQNLPPETEYTVVEALDNNYTVTAQNEQGTIEKDQTIAVQFTNVRVNDNPNGNSGGSHTPPQGQRFSQQINQVQIQKL